MRHNPWIRFGLISALAAAGASALSMVGCITDDDVNIAPARDAGTADANTPVDSGDTGANDASVAPTRIVVVHAASGIAEPVRLCMGVGAAFASAPLNVPLPSKERAPNGLGFGQGGALEIPDALLPALPNVKLTPYVVPLALADEATDAGAKTCDELFPRNDGGDRTIPAGAYKLPEIPEKTFALGNSYVVAVLGCGPNSPAPAAACGSDYDATKGNARSVVIQVDNKAAPAGQMGAQFLHLSPQANDVLSDGKVRGALTFRADSAGDAGTDGGSDAAVADLTVESVGDAVKFETSPTVTPAMAVTSAGAFANRANAAFNLYVPDGDGGTGRSVFELLSAPNVDGVPFASVAKATVGPTGDENYFQDGKTYTFIAIGDPKVAAQPTPGNTGFRIIAVANN